jgi:hypothetical protein
MSTVKPILCEPGVKYFISKSLKECRNFKDRHITLLFNIWAMLLLFAAVGGFLFYKYKGRITPSERALINRKKEEYVMSKLQYLSAIRQERSQDMITNIPTWANNPEAEIFRKKI